MKYYQQGDTLLFPLGYQNCVNAIEAKIPADAKVVRGNVYHHGATGNHHRVKGTGFKILEAGGKKFIVATKQVLLTHEEHKPIKLPKGKYELRFVQEIDVLSGLKRAVVD